jgi:small subunit ribosomal protein S9
VAENVWQGTGRRKTSVARVYLRPGSGKYNVNGKELNDYFPSQVHEVVCRLPLEVTDSASMYDISVTVTGGGPSGQAGAIRHGLSRALVRRDETNLPPLKANGFMRRDPRMVERKKYGQPKARKKFQFSKR